LLLLLLLLLLLAVCKQLGWCARMFRLPAFTTSR
jgi:hypothetical protein